MEAILDDYNRRFRRTEATPGPPFQEKDFVFLILYAIGSMQTEEAHATLVRVATTFEAPGCQAAALEMMAFEKVFFDADFVIPFLSPEQPPENIGSAIYALMYRRLSPEKTKQVRERVIPHLTHPDPNIRDEAVVLLSFDRANLVYLLPLCKDPLSHVRKDARKAVAQWLPARGKRSKRKPLTASLKRALG